MDPKEAIVWYVVFLFSVIFHEAAHAWAAKKGGDLTAYLGGQVSLDPIPHIKREPIGMIVLPIISLFIIHWPFGFASAPYDPIWAYRNHKKAAWMAMAGPASNLLLTIISILIIKVGLALGYFEIPSIAYFSVLISPTTDSPLLNNICLFLSIFCSMNLLLAIFNILPFPPLDGSEIISFFLTQSQSHRYKQFINQPMFGFLGIYIAWNAFGPIFDVVFKALLQILYF